MFSGARIAAHIGAVLVLFGLVALAGRGGGEDNGTVATTTDTVATTEITTPTTTDEAPPGLTVVRVEVVNGAPEGGIARAKIDQGDHVLLVVVSDVADEVHVHGYDVSRDLAARGTARLRFQATIPGRFEVELEERGVPIAELTVEP